MRALALFAVMLISVSALGFAQSVFHPASEVANGTFGSSVGGGNYTFNNSLVIVDRLGIGTIAPSQKLTVNGSVNVSGTVYASNFSSNSPLQLQTGGVTRIFINDTTGAVGIGTTNPVGPLHVAIVLAPSNTTATGGTITHSSGYTIHTFTTNGTFTVTGTGNVQVLVVAGGGGGSNAGSGGGGGGGGGVVYNASFPVTSQAYTITVGAGGAAGSNGANSTFSTITAIGGGAGGAYNTNGSNGGCGGGAGRDGGSESGGIGSQGYNGGKGGADFWGSAGGGGGAGAAGYDGGVDSATLSGTYSQGGDGIANSISGSSATYAGGGGGDWQSGIAQANGGAGGGGKGAANSGAVLPTAGTASTGGGGGGGHGNAGAGGSGIIIIRYTTAYDSLVVASSGNVGIGTQTPSQTLTVVGDANITGSLIGGNAFFEAQDQKASGVAAQACVSGSWFARNLTIALTNEISEASLSNNNIILPAGTYYVTAETSVIGSGGDKLRLYNLNDSAALIYGLNGYSYANTYHTSTDSSYLAGRFTLTGTKTLSLQHYVISCSNLGVAMSLAGINETYTDISIWKIR